MKFVIITNCAKSKKFPSSELLQGKNLFDGDLSTVTSEWVKRINNQNEHVLPAKDLYIGRSFKEIKSIKTKFDYEWYITSAGFGFISSEMKIPSYDLTVTENSINSIISRVDNLDSLSDWFVELNMLLWGECFPISKLVNETKDTLFLFGLSKSYYDLIRIDLNQIKNKKNIRFFGFKNSARLGEELNQYFLPYNLNFDGPDSDNNGIKNDFPRRVLKHYVEEILSKLEEPNLENEFEMVNDYISRKKPIIQRNNQKIKDDKLIIEKIKNYKEFGSNSRELLRYFRHHLGIACEEKRFRNLYQDALSTN